MKTQIKTQKITQILNLKLKMVLSKFIMSFLIMLNFILFQSCNNKEELNTSDEIKKEDEEKDRARMKHVLDNYLPKEIRDAWQQRDALLSKPDDDDWMLVYGQLQLWERKLLTLERYFQATQLFSQMTH